MNFSSLYVGHSNFKLKLFWITLDSIINRIFTAATTLLCLHVEISLADSILSSTSHSSRIVIEDKTVVRIRLFGIKCFGYYHMCAIYVKVSNLAPSER